MSLLESIPDNKRMKIFLSLSKCGYTLKRIIALRDELLPKLELGNVLVSPISMNHSIPRQLHKHRSEIQEILVDCGAFLVQQGRMVYQDIVDTFPLDTSSLPYTNWMVLPDHIPLSCDSPYVVNNKVNQTIQTATKIGSQYNDSERKVLMPVIQGITESHFAECVRTYRDLGVKRVGFGSFVTSGPQNGINSLSFTVLERLVNVIKLVNQHDLELHCFGISGPVQLLISNMLGVASIDSAAWNRIAGYGLIYVPYLRSYYIGNKGRKSRRYDPCELAHVSKEIAPDFEFLEPSELEECMYLRSLHNWNVLRYMAKHLNIPSDRQQTIINEWSPRNASLLRRAIDIANDVLIRKGRLDDLESIYKIAAMHYRELGYIRRAQLRRAIDEDRLIVAEFLKKIVGFQEYRHLKRTTVTKLYHKAVLPRFRRRGIGRELVNFVIEEARQREVKEIAVKCVKGLSANGFHRDFGFILKEVEPGKVRQLNVYSLALE